MRFYRPRRRPLTPATASAATAEDIIQYRYRYGGLQLESSEPFAQLREEHQESGKAKASLSIEVSEGRPPAPDTVLFRWNGRYELALGTIGSCWVFTASFDCAFVIDEARGTIRCFVRDRNDRAWLDVLVRRILPRVAIRYGAVALHAAAAAKGDRALLLAGPSGAGKSTTSAALGAAGWDVLSDDISILWDHNAPRIAPATTGICVWEDSFAALDLPAQRSMPMPGYAGKQRFVPGHEITTASIPLNAIVLLDRTDVAREPTLAPVPPVEALGCSTRERIRFNPAETTGAELRETFAALSAVVQVVPCYRLSYPPNYGSLPIIVERLERMLQH